MFLHVSCPGAVVLFTGFTNGVGQIWLDQVNCRGTETRLADCPANPNGTHDCTHPEDAGVRCGKASYYIAGARADLPTLGDKALCTRVHRQILHRQAHF